MQKYLHISNNCCYFAASNKITIYAKKLTIRITGLKTTQTFNEDPVLSHAVETLQKIDIEIRRKEKQETVYIRGSKLLGELTFTIDE